MNCGNCDNCLHPPDMQDVTNLAKLLISAVKETGQYFGVAHIIDVARGADTAKIKARSHNQIGVFGLAADQSKPVLQSIIRELIAVNALKVNLEKYGALEITDKGSRILRGSETFMAKVLSKVITSTAPTENSTVTPAILENNQMLLVELKKLRLALAKERSVPAFVIFSDKTLIQIANELPTSEEEFLSINGVGKTKLKAFYKPISDIITLFIKSTGADARTAEHIAVSDQL